MRDISSGILRVGNTVKRRAELKRFVERFLEADALMPDDAESLRSRLMFAVAQIFGRSAKLALKAIGRPALERRTCSPLTDDVRFALASMVQRLVDGPPREVKAAASDTLFFSWMEHVNLFQDRGSILSRP